jgi:hypothetical protein
LVGGREGGREEVRARAREEGRGSPREGGKSKANKLTDKQKRRELNAYHNLIGLLNIGLNYPLTREREFDKYNNPQTDPAVPSQLQSAIDVFYKQEAEQFKQSILNLDPLKLKNLVCNSSKEELLNLLLKGSSS